MTKKIFALVMVVSVLGAFMAGCGKKDDDTTATAGSTAGAAKDAGATAGTTGDAKTP